jgi:voltage-gated potassium channel
VISKFKNLILAENTVNQDNILENPSSKIWVILNRFITFLIVAFICVLMFESMGDNMMIYKEELYIFEAFISIIFATEYLYRLFKAEHKISFIFSFGRIIDLVSFLPFFLWVFAVWEFWKVLRIFRVFRVIRLLKKIPLTRGFIKAIWEYKDEYAAVTLLFSIILFIGSVWVYFVERWVDATLFTSIPMSIWWWLVTMTTVGFWDMVPLTNMWRFIGSFLVFLGPLTIWLFSAVTVMVFQEAAHSQNILHKHTRGNTCKRCRHKNSKDANYCIKCWEEIK